MRLHQFIASSLLLVFEETQASAHQAENFEEASSLASIKISARSRHCKSSMKRLKIQQDQDLNREVYTILIQLGHRFADNARLETPIQLANDEISTLYSILSMIRTILPDTELEILDLQKPLRKVLLATHTIDPIELRILMDLLAGSLFELAEILRQKNISLRPLPN